MRDSETLPLQWLKAYSAGCIIVCPLTDESWSLSRNGEVFNRVIDGCVKSSVLIGIGRSEGVKHPDEGLIETIAAEQTPRFLLSTKAVIPKGKMYLSMRSLKLFEQDTS